MSTALILLALGAATGFSIGTSFSWFVILTSSTALAALSAAVLHTAGFDVLLGIAIIASGLTVHQLAYGMGPRNHVSITTRLPKQRFGPTYISFNADEPGKNSKKDISRNNAVVLERLRRS